MSNPKQTYNTFVRANLPSGMTYDSTRNRYVVNGKYQFPTYLQAKWYLDYITKFGYTPPSTFTPADLFASGEEGAWYDPSDLMTMWTDTAGTTQATVGDAVARIDDKSGNGNHATRATVAARPILRQTGGGLYYLEFDGVDDCLLLGDVFDADIATASGKYDFYAAVSYNADGGLIGKWADGSQSDNQRQYISLRRASGVRSATVSYALTVTDFTAISGGSITAGQEYVLRDVFDHTLAANGGSANTAARHKCWTDGNLETISVPSSLGTLETMTDGAAQLCIGGTFGQSGPLTIPFDGKLFGLICLAGVVKSDEIADDVESYLAEKSGVTL